jgi:hypothetical protein
MIRTGTVDSVPVLDDFPALFVTDLYELGHHIPTYKPVPGPLPLTTLLCRVRIADPVQNSQSVRGDIENPL